MDADTGTEADPFKWTIADRFRTFLLATGNETDRAEAYRQFRGRDPDVTALLKRRGFPVMGARWRKMVETNAPSGTSGRALVGRASHLLAAWRREGVDQHVELRLAIVADEALRQAFEGHAHRRDPAHDEVAPFAAP